MEYTETTTSSDSLYSYSQTFGELLTDEDVDWYIGNNPYSEDEEVSMVLCLNAGLYGSTAQPHIEIYDSNFSLISSGQADENDDPSAALEGISLSSGGKLAPDSIHLDKISLSDEDSCG